MPARDIFHDTVKRALIKEDWVITHDPFWIKLVDSDINVYIDYVCALCSSSNDLSLIIIWIRPTHKTLAAERVIAAEKADQKIAVEIKSFTGTSFMADFHEALGQYLDYRVALKDREPDRQLYLAIPIDIYNAFFRRRFIQVVCQEYHVILIIFDPETEEILSWKN